MSNGEVRRVSRQDIQLVQNLIERCLQLYMDQNEVVTTLLNEAKIEPGFTELVWQKLEEENHEFFKAYRLRLMVKRQIIVFNKLLEKQAKMMSQMCSTSVTPMSFSNESHISPSSPPPPPPPPPRCYVPSIKSETIYPSVSCSIPNAFTFTNGHNTCVAMPAAELLTSMGIKAEVSGEYPMGGGSGIGGGGGSQFVFGDGVLETRRTNTGISASSFSSCESFNQPLMETSFGFLGQIPRNFSLSDLTAHFSQSSDILEYPRSPFLDHGDDRGLDSVSEGLSYEGFGND